MAEIKSILNQTLEQVYAAKDLDSGKEVMISLLEQSQIKDTDKRKMLFELTKIYSLPKLQFYVTNAMFKFEGLGVGLSRHIS